MSGSDDRALRRCRRDWASVKSQIRQTFLFPVLVEARVLNMLAHTNCFRDGDGNSLGHLFTDRGDDRSEVDLDNDHGQTEEITTALQ